MSVSNQTNKVFITGNGVTTTFSFSFPIFTSDQLVVYSINSDGVSTTLTLNTDYTVSINSSGEGGSITLNSALASGYTGLIKRVVAYTQSLSLVNEGSLPGQQVENQFDLIAMQIIQLKELTDRSVLLNATSTLSNITLPDPEDGKVLAWSGTDGTMVNVENDTASAAASAAAAAASASAASSSASSASTSASSAASSAAAAASSAASVSLPSASGKNYQLLRQNSGASGLEYVSLAAYDQIIAMISKIFKMAKGADVASASSMTLGDDGNMFKITGTTTINNITAKQAGTVVVLYFAASTTLSTSGNLKLSDTYVSAADSTITLACDGTNWYEVSRSSGIRPSFFADRANNDQTISDSTYTKIQFDTERFDTNSNYDSSTNYRFTPTVAGKYHLLISAGIKSLGAGKILQIALYKNGSLIRFKQFYNDSGSTHSVYNELSSIEDANGTDYFEAYVYHDHGSSLSLNGSTSTTYFTGSKVS